MNRARAQRRTVEEVLPPFPGRSGEYDAVLSTVRINGALSYTFHIRQKPADLLSAFAGTSTEPPRASWGRPPRFSKACRVRFPAWDRQSPGATSISLCVPMTIPVSRRTLHAVRLHPTQLHHTGGSPRFPSCSLAARPVPAAERPSPPTWEDLIGHR